MSSLVAALVLAAAVAQSGPPLGIGRSARPEEVQARDITVLPTGAGLPRGRGTAREGQSLYTARCAVCHGDKGQGQGDYPPLAGGRGSLASASPQLTVGSYWPYATTLWDYVRRAMPYEQPGGLRLDQVYAATAYVLYLNGIITQDAVIDERTLPGVRMPNRDGFVADPRPAERANKQ